MKTKEAIFKQKVSESDIDWILCIEINVNKAFQRWLSKSLFGVEIKHIHAWRSIHQREDDSDSLENESEQSKGESDLIWLVECQDSTKRMALIENKIKAPATRDQCKRYKQRAKKYIADGYCDDCVTVLMSPKRYSSKDSSEYEIRIDYEDVHKFYSKSKSTKSKYISDLINIPIEQTKTNSTFTEDEIFEHCYKIWNLANEHTPELELIEPKRGIREYWVKKKYDNYLIHFKMCISGDKATTTYVDIQLNGKAKDINKFKEYYEKSLRDIGATIEIAGKAIGFRIVTKEIYPAIIDESAILEGLKAWKTLWIWANANSKSLEKILNNSSDVTH